MKECVAKLPFIFGSLASVVTSFVDGIGSGAWLTLMSSVVSSVSSGGNRTLGAPVEVFCAHTHEAVGPSVGGVVFVHLGFCLLCNSLDEVPSS